MGRHDRHSRLTTTLWVMVFAVLLLTGMLGRAWALPGRASLGQTIPPPPTATPTKTAAAQPTATWTPRPTWTRVPTSPAVLPTPAAPTAAPTATAPALPAATVTPEASAVPATPVPGLTPTAIPAATATLALSPTATGQLAATPTPPSTAVSPTVAPTSAVPGPQPPSPLAFEVALLPAAAGPRDEVQFVLQVANVGYGPVQGVEVEVALPKELELQSVDCLRCSANCPQCDGGPFPARLTVVVGTLLPGEQVIAPVRVQVAADVWPGQTLHLDWTCSAADLPAQTARVSLVLPWAPLPQTGCDCRATGVAGL